MAPVWERIFETLSFEKNNRKCILMVHTQLLELLKYHKNDPTKHCSIWKVLKHYFQKLTNNTDAVTNEEFNSCLYILYKYFKNKDFKKYLYNFLEEINKVLDLNLPVKYEKSALRFFKVCLQESPIKYNEQVQNFILKLGHKFPFYGEIDIQIIGLEIFETWHEEIQNLTEKLFTGNNKLQKRFNKLMNSYSKRNIRKFLNYLNDTHNNVYVFSIAVERIFLENEELKDPQDSNFFIDLNLGCEYVSFYYLTQCLSTNSSTPDDNKQLNRVEIIMINFNIISEVAIIDWKGEKDDPLNKGVSIYLKFVDGQHPVCENDNLLQAMKNAYSLTVFIAFSSRVRLFIHLLNKVFKHKIQIKPNVPEIQTSIVHCNKFDYYDTAHDIIVRSDIYENLGDVILSSQPCESSNLETMRGETYYECSEGVEVGCSEMIINQSQASKDPQDECPNYNHYKSCNHDQGNEQCRLPVSLHSSYHSVLRANLRSFTTSSPEIILTPGCCRSLDNSENLSNSSILQSLMTDSPSLNKLGKRAAQLQIEAQKSDQSVQQIEENLETHMNSLSIGNDEENPIMNTNELNVVNSSVDDMQLRDIEYNTKLVIQEINELSPASDQFSTSYLSNFKERELQRVSVADETVMIDLANKSHDGSIIILESDDDDMNETFEEKVNIEDINNMMPLYNELMPALSQTSNEMEQALIPENVYSIETVLIEPYEKFLNNIRQSQTRILSYDISDDDDVVQPPLNDECIPMNEKKSFDENNRQLTKDIVILHNDVSLSDDNKTETIIQDKKSLIQTRKKQNDKAQKQLVGAKPNKAINVISKEIEVKTTKCKKPVKRKAKQTEAQKSTRTATKKDAKAIEQRPPVELTKSKLDEKYSKSDIKRILESSDMIVESYIDIECTEETPQLLIKPTSDSSSPSVNLRFESKTNSNKKKVKDNKSSKPKGIPRIPKRKLNNELILHPPKLKKTFNKKSDSSSNMNVTLNSSATTVTGGKRRLFNARDMSYLNEDCMMSELPETVITTNTAIIPAKPNIPTIIQPDKVVSQPKKSLPQINKDSWDKLMSNVIPDSQINKTHSKGELHTKIAETWNELFGSQNTTVSDKADKQNETILSFPSSPSDDLPLAELVRRSLLKKQPVITVEQKPEEVAPLATSSNDSIIGQSMQLTSTPKVRPSKETQLNVSEFNYEAFHQTFVELSQSTVHKNQDQGYQALIKQSLLVVQQTMLLYLQHLQTKCQTEEDEKNLEKARNTYKLAMKALKSLYEIGNK